jgi:hypothetical protein
MPLQQSRWFYALCQETRGFFRRIEPIIVGEDDQIKRCNSQFDFGFLVSASFNARSVSSFSF